MTGVLEDHQDGHSEDQELDSVPSVTRTVGTVEDEALVDSDTTVAAALGVVAVAVEVEVVGLETFLAEVIAAVGLRTPFAWRTVLAVAEDTIFFLF